MKIGNEDKGVIETNNIEERNNKEKKNTKMPL